MEDGRGEVIIAYCGLVCSDCGMFKKNRCLGCQSEKPKFKNCSVRKCAISRNYNTCAECSDFENLGQCKKLNNIISKIFGFIFGTNRIGNLNRIKEVGLGKFTEDS